ncbi:hypothetical protein [Terrisporobacter sp.]
MCEIIDFYKYKYCRGNYFINIFISKETACKIRKLLIEKIKDEKISNDYKCAYSTLKEKIDENMKESTYVKLKINKCYLQYLKDLYYDFYNREESIYIKELIYHIQYFMKEDKYNIYKFCDLMESTKIDILLKT